jgi:hypothetical protein
LIKKALIDYNQSGKGDQYERDIMLLMIETLDEAIDQVMTNKYADKVFGAPSNVPEAHLLEHF